MIEFLQFHGLNLENNYSKLGVYIKKQIYYILYFVIVTGWTPGCKESISIYEYVDFSQVRNSVFSSKAGLQNMFIISWWNLIYWIFSQLTVTNHHFSLL